MLSKLYVVIKKVMMHKVKDSYIDKLRKVYGTNKIIPPQFEQAALTALSHYPELMSTRIEFVITKNAFFPYSSRPVIRSLFSNRQNRRYQIVIADHSIKIERILLKNLPFKAQVGILGHELAHTAFYCGQTNLNLLRIGLCYFWPSFRETFEKNTDRAAIAHGLGEELYEYSSYIRKVDDVLKSNSWIEKYYLNPQEIMEGISQFQNRGF